LFTNLKRRIVVVDELTPYLVERKTGPPLSSLKKEKPQKSRPYLVHNAFVKLQRNYL